MTGLSTGSSSSESGSLTAPRIAIVAFGLLMAVDIATSILRIEQGGWLVWPAFGLAFFFLMMHAIRKRHALAYPSLRTFSFVSLLIGGLELMSHTALFRWHGAVLVPLSLLGVAALSTRSARRFFGADQH